MRVPFFLLYFIYNWVDCFHLHVFQIMLVKKHRTKYILHKWESGMTGLIWLLTNCWLNLYVILNNIYCLILRYVSGIQHVCSHWEKHNEYMATHITCHLLSPFEVYDFRYCPIELFWWNQWNENPFKVFFLGKVRREGYIRYSTCMQYCRLQRKTKKWWGHIMILIFLTEYGYLFNWSESCCVLDTQSTRTKQKINTQTKTHTQPSVMKFMI